MSETVRPVTRCEVDPSGPASLAAVESWWNQASGEPAELRVACMSQREDAPVVLTVTREFLVPRDQVTARLATIHASLAEAGYAPDRDAPDRGKT